MPDMSWARKMLFLTVDTAYFGAMRIPVQAWPHANVLRVPLWDNETVEEVQAANYATLTVLGRAGGFLIYQNAANNIVDLAFHFVAGDQDDTGNLQRSSAIDAVYEKVQWLFSLTLPIIFSNVSYPPPPIYLHLGGLFTYRVLATSVSPRWLAPYDPATGRPQMADVQCQFTVLHDNQ